MLKSYIMEENGFSQIRIDCYFKKIHDITLMAEEKDRELFLFSYCASPLIDNEYDIDSYFKQKIDGLTYSKAIYGGRKLEIRFSERCDESDMENIRTVSDVLTDLSNHFDLLPTCMKCGNVTPVKLYNDESGVQILCDVCRGENELKQKHEKIIEEHKAQADGDNEKYISIMPLKVSVKIALKGGLIGIAVYMFMLLLAIFTHPAVALMPWIPSAIAGYYTSSRVNKMDVYSGHIIRVVVSSVVCVLFMMLLMIILGQIVMGSSGLLFMFNNNYHLIFIALIIMGYFGAFVLSFIIKE